MQNTDYVLTPNQGAPRIIRFVVGSLPHNMVASLDIRTNVLTIDKQIFDQLPPLKQAMVEKTRVSLCYGEDNAFTFSNQGENA